MRVPVRRLASCSSSQGSALDRAADAPRCTLMTTSTPSMSTQLPAGTRFTSTLYRPSATKSLRTAAGFEGVKIGAENFKT